MTDRWGDPPNVTSPILGPPPSCKQALRLNLFPMNEPLLNLFKQLKLEHCDRKKDYFLIVQTNVHGQLRGLRA